MFILQTKKFLVFHFYTANKFIEHDKGFDARRSKTIFKGIVEQKTFRSSSYSKILLCNVFLIKFKLEKKVFGSSSVLGIRLQK